MPVDPEYTKMYIEIFVYRNICIYLPKRKHMALQNIVGAPVTEANFFGREKEVRLGLNKLRNGNSLILSAPRRVGKTSFSKKMIEQLEKEGWLGIYINMEHLRDEMELYNEIADKLYETRGRYERLTKGAKDFLQKITFTIKDSAIKYHDEHARNSIRTDILKIINDPEREGKFLFVFDELAVFLNEISSKGQEPEHARNFLNWLRSVRQESSNKAAWIFSSSISIENYLSIYDLSSTTNDMLPFEIGEMPEEEALGLIQSLSDGMQYTFTLPVQKYMLKRLGALLPHNIQGLFSEIVDEMPEGETKVNDSIVDAAYEHLVRNAAYFGTWYQRLRDYKEESDLKRILHYMCKSPNGVSEDELFSAVFPKPEETDFAALAQLLRILQHDGYIIRAIDGRFSFRLNLLKDYWAYYNL